MASGAASLVAQTHGPVGHVEVKHVHCVATLSQPSHLVEEGQHGDAGAPIADAPERMLCEEGDVSGCTVRAEEGVYGGLHRGGHFEPDAYGCAGSGRLLRHVGDERRSFLGSVELSKERDATRAEAPCEGSNAVGLGRRRRRDVRYFPWRTRRGGFRCIDGFACESREDVPAAYEKVLARSRNGRPAAGAEARSDLERTEGVLGVCG
jgi:hypothetical protein